MGQRHEAGWANGVTDMQYTMRRPTVPEDAEPENRGETDDEGSGRWVRAAQEQVVFLERRSSPFALDMLFPGF